MNESKTDELREQIAFATRQYKHAEDDARAVYHARMKRIAKKFLKPGTKISFQRFIEGSCVGTVLDNMPKDFVRQDVVVIRDGDGHKRWLNIDRIREVK